MSRYFNPAPPTVIFCVYKYLLYLSDVSSFLGKICKKFLKVNWDELTGIHHKSDTLEFIIRYNII